MTEMRDELESLLRGLIDALADFCRELVGLCRQVGEWLREAKPKLDALEDALKVANAKASLERCFTANKA